MILNCKIARIQGKIHSRVITRQVHNDEARLTSSQQGEVKISKVKA